MSSLVVLRRVLRGEPGTLDEHPSGAVATVADGAAGVPADSGRPALLPRRTLSLIAGLVCLYLMVIGPVFALDYWGFGVRRPLVWMGVGYGIAALVALALTKTSRGPALLVIPLALLMGVSIGIVVLERWHTPQFVHGLSNVNEVSTTVLAAAGGPGEWSSVEAEHPEVYQDLKWETGGSEDRDLLVLHVNVRLKSNEMFVADFPVGAEVSDELTWPEAQADDAPPSVQRYNSLKDEWEAVPDALSARHGEDDRLEMTFSSRAEGTYRVTFRVTYDAVERRVGPGRTRHSLWWWTRFPPEQSSIEFGDRQAESVENPYPAGRANARKAMVWAVAAPDRYQVDTVYPLGLLSDTHKYLGLVAASILGAHALSHPRRAD